VIAITGLTAEAGIASAPGVHVFACGGNVELSSRAIAQAVEAGSTSIVSFGIAGGLDETLKPGDWVVAESVSGGDRFIGTDRDWSSRLAERLPRAHRGGIVSVSHPVLQPSAKRHLCLTSGAIAVDMESFQAAALADRLGVPFAAIRVVADPAQRALPAAARLGLRPNGTIAVCAVLNSLLREPSQLPAMLRVAGETAIAFRALMRDRKALGPHFASINCPTVVQEAGARSRLRDAVAAGT
jgi:adenosylhomocysteine nucleosidase